MSTYERARDIIAAELPACRGLPLPDAAGRLLGALLDKRLTVVTMRASREMFVRFHAHARFLGQETGEGYEAIYNQAIEYAEGMGQWPIKMIARTVTLDTGDEVTVDVAVPQSTTRASNKQLVTAYEYVEMVAREHEIVLPENYEET